MPKFAANLSFLFADLPYLDRFDAAAAAGFDAVEMLSPYDMAAKETQRALLRNGQELILFNAPPPNYTGGDRGFAAIVGGEARFQTDLRRAMRYAEALKPRFLHVMAGVAEGPEARATFVSNLRLAAEYAPTQMFTIEPLNGSDQPGYFLNDFDLAADLIAEIDRPNVVLQYDAYHAQMIHGDALAVWKKYGHLARHIQIGSAPGRHQPGQGDMDFAALFRAIDEAGYDGHVSAEYTPTGRTEDSLDWMKI